MPVYEYRCIKCGHVFEEYVSKIREKYVECRECEDTAIITDRIFAVNGHVAGSWFNNLKDDDDV